MTAPIPPLRKQTTYSFSPNGSTPRHRGDELVEYLLSSKGQENVGLAVLALSCIALIFALRWS